MISDCIDCSEQHVEEGDSREADSCGARAGRQKKKADHPLPTMSRTVRVMGPRDAHHDEENGGPGEGISASPRKKGKK